MLKCIALKNYWRTSEIINVFCPRRQHGSKQCLEQRMCKEIARYSWTDCECIDEKLAYHSSENSFCLWEEERSFSVWHSRYADNGYSEYHRNLVQQLLMEEFETVATKAFCPSLILELLYLHLWSRCLDHFPREGQIEIVLYTYQVVPKVPVTFQKIIKNVWDVIGAMIIFWVASEIVKFFMLHYYNMFSFASHYSK